MYSMTAYSCVASEGEWGRLVWECRSVNHRYLDVSFRMPEAFHYLENKLKEEARALSRGKVDCFLAFKSSTNFKNHHLSIDLDRVKYLLGLAEQVNAWIPTSAPINAMDLLSRSDIWIKEEIDATRIEKSILSLFSDALHELLQQRKQEGLLLKKEIQKRLTDMLKGLENVKIHLPEILIEQRKKLTTRLEEIASTLDTHRLEQEMIYLAQKMDVSEELDRLFIHLNEIQIILQQPEKPVGRRLDFLMQELNREVNTLGSKTAQSKVIKIVVDLKVLIEQIREQIQNIV